jgi:hypothetical protein
MSIVADESSKKCRKKKIVNASVRGERGVSKATSYSSGDRHRLTRDTLLAKHSDDDSSVQSSDGDLRFPEYNSTSLLGKHSVSVGVDGDNELLETKRKQAKTTASGVAKTKSHSALPGVRNSESIGDGAGLSVGLAKSDEQKTQEH